MELSVSFGRRDDVTLAVSHAALLAFGGQIVYGKSPDIVVVSLRFAGVVVLLMWLLLLCHYDEGSSRENNVKIA